MEKFKVNDWVKEKKTAMSGRVVAVHENGIVCVDWFSDTLFPDSLGREDIFADQLVNVTSAAEGCLTKEAAFNAGMDAARTMPAAQKLTKPVSIGGVRFHAGVDVSHVLRAAERRYEYEQSPEYKAQQEKRMAQFMASIDRVVITGPMVLEKWESVCQELARAEVVGGAAFDEFDLAMQGLAKPAGDGCGACGDACASRGGCRLDDDSPKPAGEAVALDVEMTFKLLRNHGMTTGCANLTIDILNNWLAQRTAPPAQPAPVAGEAVAEVVSLPSKHASGPKLRWFVGAGVRVGMKLYTAPPAQVPDAVALLREMEWANNKWADCCPVCEEKKERGHLVDCRLAAALAAPQPKGDKV